MREVLTKPPRSEPEPVTDLIHGTQVPDPYRWLEDQQSPRTRQWLSDQTQYARDYLDAIPKRDSICRRVRELLDIETCDSILAAGTRYFFRKRLPQQEQPCIYMRNVGQESSQLLVDPARRGTGKFTAVQPLIASPDGKLLAYEVKEGGERAGRIELIDVETQATLPDGLPHGYLRAFAFAADSRSFYYAQDRIGQEEPFERIIFQHKLGTPREEDVVVFRAQESRDVRLGLIAGPRFLLIFVRHFVGPRTTDCYLQLFERETPPVRLLSDIDFLFGPKFVNDRIFVLTDLRAPNLRIVELRFLADWGYELIEVVSTNDLMIRQWAVVGSRIVVSYLRGTSCQIFIFDLAGNKVGEIPVEEGQSVRLIADCPDGDQVLLQSESFFESCELFHYSIERKERAVWNKSAISLDQATYIHKQVWFRSKDGTIIPMFLAGRRDVLDRADSPTIMTSYGGFGSAMTPQFSVFVSFLMEKGCVFALPNIRGGGEFGPEWHEAAKRHNRQRAFDDFLRAAEWLILTGTVARNRLAIFGGSNSGLLVGAALTQAPSLFRAVVCNAPLLDMIRYHLFDGAIKWKDEFGTADDPNDFAALWEYSPYHRVRDNVHYPAVMMISGDSDQRCNPLHARKMVARLQAANVSTNSIILDYSSHRGHSPVLPLSTRIQALTDRMAFLCDQLELSV